MAQSPSESDTLPPSSVPDWLSTVLKLVPSLLALLVTLFSRGRSAASSLRSQGASLDDPKVDVISQRIDVADPRPMQPDEVAGSPKSVDDARTEWV